MIKFNELEKDFIKNLINYAINSNYLLSHIENNILRYIPLYDIDYEDLSKMSLKELEQLKDNLDKNKVLNSQLSIINDLLYFAKENNFIDCELEKISDDELQTLKVKVEENVERREINDLLYPVKERDFIND